MVSHHGSPVVCGVIEMSDEQEPFVGLADFLIRHAAPDDNSRLSSRKIFIAYRAYITRKRPDIYVSMDFARFCSYLEHLAQQFQYKKINVAHPHATLYRIRFKSLKKLHRVKKLKASEKRVGILVRDLNENICCQLCCGYLVDATSITECLHTFCKSCIVKHFQVNQHCPTCDLLVHERTPMAFIKRDMVLQDIVYKLLPGLEKTERKRITEYERSNPVDNQSGMTPQMKQDLQFKPFQFILEWVGLKHCTLMAEEIPEKHIRVSGKATVGHVSQFVLQKLQNIDSSMKPTVQCDIKSGGAILPSILMLEQIEKQGLDFEEKKGWLCLQYDIKPMEEP